MPTTLFWRSWDRATWCISMVKLSRCTIFEFIGYHSTYFGRSSRPSSGVQDCTHSIRYMSNRLVDCLLAGTSSISCPLASSQLTIWHIPDAVCTVLNSLWRKSWTRDDESLELLMMNRKTPDTRRVIFNKLDNCASSWFYYRNVPHTRSAVRWKLVPTLWIRAAII
jgi:hypothetical protein